MMLTRPVTALTVCLATATFTASPAVAQSPTDRPVPGALPGACVEHLTPTSYLGVRAARRASRRHVLRGTASDRGCGVDRVELSVARKLARGCRLLSRRHRLGRRSSCARRIWLVAKGTTRWSFRLPKRLHPGRYVVRLRAIDFAGNVQQPRRRRLRILR
jgi:hypothetical protein